MSEYAQIRVRDPKQPHRLTLDVMGRTANQAAHTWAFREWAGRLAARAPPRDYVDQLRQIYDEILRHWSYVQEPAEFVHGSARSLIAHVLGSKYSRPGEEPTSVSIPDLPTTPITRGWGDCDDVATVVAAAAIAIGMPVVLWRVARTRGGAHVSVVVRTPRGETVSVDPVGHPTHKFGWAAPAPIIELYRLDGTPVGKRAMPTRRALQGVDVMQAGYGTSPETFFIGRGNTLRGGTRRGHWCAVARDDASGPRVLSVPERAMRGIERGIMTDGVEGVDENGRQYRYDLPRDLWVDQRLARTRLGKISEEEGGIAPLSGRLRDRRRAKRKRIKRRKAERAARDPKYARRLGRRRKRRTKARKFIKRIGKGIRKFTGKLLQSKWVQNVVGGILNIWGVPRRLTMGVLAAGGYFIERVGLIGFIRMLRTDKKQAGRIIAQAAKAGLKGAGIDLDKFKKRGKSAARGAVSKGISAIKSKFAGLDGGCADVDTGGPLSGLAGMYEQGQDEDWGTQYKIRQQGRNGRLSQPFSAAPVVAIVGVPGVYDVDETKISTTPVPGRWYRVQYGDNLLKVSGEAFDLGAGGARYKKAKMIDASDANQRVHTGKPDNLFPKGKISFMPIWAADVAANVRGESGTSFPIIWIPEFEGDNPAQKIPGDDPGIPGGDLPDLPDSDKDPVDEDQDSLPDDPGDDDDDADPGDIVPPLDPGDDPVIPDGETDSDDVDDEDTTDEIPGDTDPQDPTIGPQGPRGRVGPAGPTGPRGTAGPRGAPGSGGAGSVGPQGMPGARGAAGSAGPRGLPGAGGSPGVPGVIGPRGPAGPTGPAGVGGAGGDGVPSWFVAAALSVLSGAIKL